MTSGGVGCRGRPFVLPCYYVLLRVDVTCFLTGWRGTIEKGVEGGGLSLRRGLRWDLFMSLLLNIATATGHATSAILAHIRAWQQCRAMLPHLRYVMRLRRQTLDDRTCVGVRTGAPPADPVDSSAASSGAAIRHHRIRPSGGSVTTDQRPAPHPCGASRLFRAFGDSKRYPPAVVACAAEGNLRGRRWASSRVPLTGTFGLRRAVRLFGGFRGVCSATVRVEGVRAQAGGGRTGGWRTATGQEAVASVASCCMRQPTALLGSSYACLPSNTTPPPLARASPSYTCNTPPHRVRLSFFQAALCSSRRLLRDLCAGWRGMTAACS